MADEVVSHAFSHGLHPEHTARLAAYWAEVETRLAGQRTLAEYLRGRLSGRSSEMYGKFVVETVDVPERVVITETRHTLADELPAWIGNIEMTGVRAFARSWNVRLAGGRVTVEPA